MAQTMECPQCGEEILASAVKCKHCFADLTLDDTKGNRRTIVGLVVFLVTLVLIGIGGIRYVYSAPSLASVTVDEGTRSIVMIWSHFNKEPTTRRIPFEDIQKIEYITGSTVIGGNYWSVYVILSDGEKLRVNHSTKDPLKGYAETVAAKTGAPYHPINKTRGGRGFFGPGS